MSLVHVKSNTIGNATGTVSVWNTQGSSTTVAASALVQPQDWNSAHQMTQLFSGNTLGSSSVSGTDLVWAAGNNITLSASQAAGSGAVTIQGPPNLSTWMPREFGQTLVSVVIGTLNTASSSIALVPFNIPAQVQGNCVRVWMQDSIISSSIALSHSGSRYWGLYTNNVGTLSLASSGSMSMLNTQSSGSGTVSYPASSNSAGYTYSTTTWTATAQANSLFGSVGMRAVDFVFGGNFTLSQGQYWLGLLNVGSTAGGNGGIAPQFLGNSISPGLLASVAPMGQTIVTSATNPHAPYQGYGFATGTTGAMKASIAFSNINQGAVNLSNMIPLLAVLST